MQNTLSGFVRLAAPLAPLLTATGTDTFGKRIPPSAIPFASRTSVTGGPRLDTSIGSAFAGGTPSATQRSSAAYAASKTAHTSTSLGPGLRQSTGGDGPYSRVWMPPRVARKSVASGETAAAGTCEPPAISHVRIVAESETRSAACDPNTSVSVYTFISFVPTSERGTPPPRPTTNPSWAPAAAWIAL